MLPRIKRSIKSNLLSLLSYRIPADNGDLRRGWNLVSRALVHQYVQITVLVVASLIAAVFEGATMGLLGLAVSTFVDGEAALASKIPEFLQGTFQSIVGLFNRDTFFLVLVGAAVLAQILKSVSLALSDWMQINLTYGTRRILQQHLTAHIMNMSYANVSTYPSGRLATLIDQSKLIIDITIQFGNIVRAIFMGLAYLIVMIALSTYLALTISLIVLVLWLLLSIVIRMIRTLAERATLGELEVWRWTVEYLNAPRLLRIFNNTGYAQSMINNAWKEQLAPERRTDLILSLVPKTLEIVTVAGAGAFLILVFLFTPVGKETVVSTLFVYVLIFFRLRPVLKSFSDFRAKLARIIPRLEVVGTLLGVRDSPTKVGSTKRYSGLEREIVFENVSFRYPGSETSVLDDVTFSLAKGSTVALVGKSGAGKSTISDLMLGLFAPTAGRILVDGVDLNELDMVSWREHIGVVDQEAFLLNTSVRENISFARLDVSQDKVVAVARAANADEFIRNLDIGYDTVLGDRGLRLSGGQQQRVVLARALLRNPEILVLDEATSALDTESEKIIQDTLEKMHSERTILVIAHRLSTIISADNIIVIDGGKIVEQGSAEKLLQQTGKFSELWSYQQAPK